MTQTTNCNTHDYINRIMNKNNNGDHNNKTTISNNNHDTTTQSTTTTTTTNFDYYTKYEQDFDRRLFQLLDTNKDGLLTPQDIRYALRKLRMPYTDRHVKEVFDSISKKSMITVDQNVNNNNDNNNNNIESNQQTQQPQQQQQQQQQNVITQDQFQSYVITKYKQLKALFHEFDTNQNGKIERDEVEHMLNKLKIEHSRHDVQRIMQLMDRDNDGTIGFNEFCDLLMVLPIRNIEHLLESWMEAAAFDIEDGVIPPASAMHSTKTSVLIHLAAGALSGAASRTGTAPFERLKILYQIQTKAPPNLWQGFKIMYRDGGLLGLWRGNLINVIKIVPESALRWVLFEAAKNYFSHQASDDVNMMNEYHRENGEHEEEEHRARVLEKVRPPTPYQLFLAGSVAGCISHFALYPLEVIKTRITASNSSLGLFQIIRRINAQEGRILPYFKGLGISLASVVPLSGVNLAIYELVKRFFVDDQPGKEPGVLGLLAAGTISSTFSQTLFYPMHTIKARLIIQNHGLESLSQGTYTNTWDVVRKTMKHEGFLGMYRGYIPSLLKAVPAHCIAFVSYEASKKALSDMANK